MDDRPPQCPKPERLEELIQALSEARDYEHDELAKETVEALSWTQWYLENRKFHHRKSTLKNTIRRNMLQEALPESELEVNKMAERLRDDEIVNS